MRFQRIIEAVFYQPWFITATGYLSVRRLVLSRALTFPVLSDRKEATPKAQLDMADLFNPRPEMSIDPNKVAHIHIVGVLGKNLAAIEKSCGNTDYNEVMREILDAKGQGARGIMYHANSPGGAVSGCAETMRAIADSGLPSVLIVDEQCCSAAGFLACAVDRIYAPPSATTGSIGCILPWVDESEAWKQEGLHFEPITNDEADLKSAGKGPSLTKDQRDALTQYVNDQFAIVRAIMSERRTLTPEAFRGQVFASPRALQNSLIDAIGSEDDAYAYLFARFP